LFHVEPPSVEYLIVPEPDTTTPVLPLTEGPAIGRYERGVAKPTIEVAAKIAKILGVSLDYLTGNSDVELDADTLKRIQEVDKLSEEDKKMVYTFLDSFIEKTKIKAIVN
jgi:transcriptional regulator with XRE-family HTH domain